MTGTLRATLVPYDEDHALHAAAVETLDNHSTSYPISGEVLVSVPSPLVIFPLMLATGYHTA